MSGGGTNTVQTQSVPDWLKPYYETGLDQGGQLLSTGGPQYYPGQTVAPLNPVQEQGIQMGINTANGPNATQGAIGANNFETSGALLNPSMNPYLQGTFHQAANAVQNQLSSEFAQNGSNVLNSLPVQSDEMNNLATQLYGGAYNQGLQYMTQAQAFAPGLDQSSYMPSQYLNQMGAGLQNQTQDLINANQQAWNYNQTLPYNQLSWYSGILGQNGQPFQSQNSAATMQNNRATGALGGAAAGAAAGSSFGPYGTAIGAVGGGLLGAFG